MKPNILIVDDTITYRRILSKVASFFPDVGEIVTSPSGSVALQKLSRSDFHLVLLDIHMDGMDGIETLKQIKTLYPKIEVIMVSGISQEGAAVTITALNLGALAFVSKPKTTTNYEDGIQILCSELIPLFLIIKNRLLLYHANSTALQKTDSHPQGVLGIKIKEQIKPLSQQTISPQSFGILAIGVSTGGPKALATLLPSLSADFPLPIVIVQHMPPFFTAALVKDLARKTSLHIKEAVTGDCVIPGRILLAPGGKHMVLRSKQEDIVVGLTTGPPENSCRPAVDVLFRSVAQYYGNHGVLAVIMTGMGSDGLKGVNTLKRKICYCITQSAASCVVYGMPFAIDKAGLSDESLDLINLAPRIEELAWKGRIRK